MDKSGKDSVARILVIIPCYNESRSIASVLAEVRSLNLGEIETLVIDDGSKDNTFEIARPLSRCVRLVVNLGIGGAVQTGIRYAVEHGYEYCVQLDGDGQHPAVEIPRLVEAASERAANLVVGSRFLSNSGFTSTALRRMGISVIVRSYQMLFNRKISDPTSGFRLMDRRAMLLFQDDYPQDFPEPITIGSAIIAGLEISEVPVQMRERVHGQSSIGGWKNFAYMIRVIGNLIFVRLKQK